jgi:hypothetical protein
LATFPTAHCIETGNPPIQPELATFPFIRLELATFPISTQR